MKNYKTENIRNVSFIGNGGTGKTSLMEAILYNLGGNNRLGSVDEGTSLCDYQPEELKRKMSMIAKLVSLEKNNKKYNFFDTPGFDDFQAEVKRVVPHTENIYLVVDPTTGIVGHTEKVWGFAEETDNAKGIFVNKLDKERADFDQMVSLIEESISNKAVPVFIPIGKENDFKGIVDIIHQKAYITDGNTSKATDIPADLKDKVEELREKLMESAAESDEALMEKYFEEGTLTNEEFINGLKKSYAQGSFYPIFCGSSLKNIGIREFIDFSEDFFANPLINDTRTGVNPDKNNEEVTRKLSEQDPISLFIFKTQSEQHTGELVFFKMISGVLKSGTDLKNTTTDNTERINQMVAFKAKEKMDISEVCPGDIAVTMKLKGSYTNHTLSDPKAPIAYPEIEFPAPVISIALVPKSKNDQEKCASALSKFVEEDPTFRMEFMPEFSQLIVSGMGESHLNNIIEKLRNRYNVQVDVDKPRIAYRETIKKKTKCEKKYKKQSGGRGQYGHVVMEISPLSLEENYKFGEKIFGGAIPAKFIPSIEKGVKEAMLSGVLAGCPVIGVETLVIDGSYHDVDSSDMAFKIAGSMAFKDGMEKANPILLEPIMEVEIIVPEE
jgi:elongation factor G